MDFWKQQWPKVVPLDHIEFNLKYTFFRRIPTTVYERVSVRLHHITVEHDTSRKDWKNVVYIERGKLKLLLQRHRYVESRDPELSIDFRGPCDKIDQLWDWCCEIYRGVLQELIEHNDIVTYSKTFVCPHCILTGRSFENSQQYAISSVMDSKCEHQEERTCDKTTDLVPVAYSRPLLPSKKICKSNP